MSVIQQQTERARVSAVTHAHQRADGEARIVFKCGPDNRTSLADLYQRAPCRFLFPSSEPDETLQSVLLTTSGGLTGGDRTRIAVTVGTNARATVTTQAAEKIYRALPGTGDAVVEVDMRVADGAWAEWLAQETIVFEGSRLRRLFSAEVSSRGRLLAVESIVFGRTAMGESFQSGMLHDAWRVRCGRKLIWADALHLDGNVAELRAAPFGFGTSVACATVLYVGADAPRQLDEVRRLLSSSSPNSGATLLDGIVLARIMADDAAELRKTVMKLIAGIRQAAVSLPARLPRVWHC